MQKSQVNVNDELVNINREFEERSVRERARVLNLAYADISHLSIDSSLRNKFPVQEWILSHVIPFRVTGKTVHIAIADPNDERVKNILTDLRANDWVPKVYLATTNSIDEAYQRLHGIKEFIRPESFKNIVDESKVGNVDRELAILRMLKQEFRQASSAEMLNTILVGAERLKASDIHIEPFAEDVRLRFRLDGVLHEAFRFSIDEYDKLATQIKHKAGVKLNLSAIPQDGRFNFEVNQREIDIRVSIIPTEFGDGMVLRLLDSRKEVLGFNDLGIDETNKKMLENAIKKVSGMLVVTGPTGSGKSTTLYAILQKLNTEERKIITLEDPVEYHLEGVEQSQIQTAENYTFADGLRAVLRHDPEVIMVGEIRDPETARVAMQAAITGHLVLTTLHTNDTVSTILRFTQMNIEPYLIAPSISTIVAQRLVRKVCPDCGSTRKVTDDEKNTLLSMQKAHGNFEIPSEVSKIVGCDKCSGTGYQGRTGLYEILPIDDEIRRAIITNISSPDLYALCIKKGLRTIFLDGISKVAQKITSLEEVLRVLGE
ncbi:MAG: GspE/PulE family protein [Patescibacteria group bacterium]|nr:GspE/PulE family protein [Patescibacteria group bacterium]